MLSIVPATFGDVDTATEYQRVIDNNDFLMMAGADGMVAVKGQMELLRRKQLELECRKDAPGRNQRTPAPFQQIDIQSLASRRKCIQKRTDGVRKTVRRIAVVIRLTGQHLDLEVKIPTDENDHTLCFQQHFAKDAEIVLPIHDDGQPIGRRNTPAVSTRFEGKALHIFLAHRLFLSCSPNNSFRSPKVAGSIDPRIHDRLQPADHLAFLQL